MDGSLGKLVNGVIEGKSVDFWTLSRFIWEHPELALNEVEAHAKLTEFLEQREFRVQRKYLLSTAFRAEFDAPGGTDGPTIAFLCEYDALPEIGHACGHNLIAELAVASAVAVRDAMKQSHDLRGKVVVLGTPGEENCGGKQMLIDKGAFKDIDIALMSHPFPYEALRTGFTARQQVTVRFRGRSAHAAESAYKGVNALDAAVASYVNVSLLRQQIKPTCRVHGVILRGGMYPNLIPESSELSYHIRGADLAELDDLVMRVEGCFRAAALATGCSMSLEWGIRYKNLVHNVALTRVYRKHGLSLGAEFLDADMSNVVPTGAATDAGNVSHCLPTLHSVYAVGTGVRNHTRGFAELAGAIDAQGPTRRTAKALALTAIELLSDPALVQQIKAEFAEWRRNTLQPAAVPGPAPVPK
ncbi:xaa-Arg dipeptidase-like isoform X2 [Amblyomma americanum]